MMNTADSVKKRHYTESIDKHGNTRLHLMSISDNISTMLNFLIHNNMNMINKKGDTPLHIAFTFRNLSAIDTLLRAGADMNIKNSYGLTPGEDIISDKGLDYPAEVDTVAKLYYINYSDKKGNMIWIRHAETLQNFARTYLNNKEISIFDANLTDRGNNISKFIGKWIKKGNLFQNIDLFVTSPLTRALETTSNLLLYSDKPTIVVDNKIREKISKNSCTGVSKSFLQKEFPLWEFRMPEEWWYGPTNNKMCNIKKKEPLGAIKRRTDEFLEEYSNKNKNIIVLSHGGIMKFLFGYKFRNCGSFVMTM